MNKDVIEFLTPKQLKFCNEYLVDMNATAAALRAGYSASTALNGQLMAMPKIKLFLQDKTAEAAQKAQVSHAMVLSELCKIAFGNMANYFTDDGSIKPTNELSDDAKAALWSVSVGDAGSGSAAVNVTKFRMYNKLSALDKIAKHIGFYVPQTVEAKTIYSYVTHDDLNADDIFDDPDLEKRAQELREEEKIWKDGQSGSVEEVTIEREEDGKCGSREEMKNESQDARIKSEDKIDEDYAGEVVGDPAIMIDEDVNDYKINPNETPDELLARLG